MIRNNFKPSFPKADGSVDKVLNHIDLTLNALIETTTALHALQAEAFFSEEASVLKKKQGSLLADLMQMQSLLHSYAHNSYREKMEAFERLHTELCLKAHQTWTTRKT